MNNYTKLRFKSNYPVNDKHNDVIMGFLNYITSNKDYRTESYETEGYSYPVCVFEYHDHEQLKEVIAKFNDHRYIPFDEFDDVESGDFEISLQSPNINESFSFLNEKNFNYVEEQINMIDYICTDIVSEQEDIKEKVDAMNLFMVQSGVYNYKQVVLGLLDALHSKGIIDKTDVEKKAFTQIH